MRPAGWELRHDLPDGCPKHASPPRTNPFPLCQADEEAQGGGANLRFEAGYALLGTAVNAPSHEADATERREWLSLAAAALRAAGEHAAAAQISAALGGGQAAGGAAVGLGGARAT